MEGEEFTSLDIAKRCPRCQEPGKEIRVANNVPGTPGGTKMHVFQCKTGGCGWENTNWLVQENPDGTIPIRKDEPRKPKQFGYDRTLAAQILARMQAELDLSIKLGQQRPS